MGQGTEICTDRPSEVSVIKFVSRNRTVEEIRPKKEVYTCKQRGCGKIFTNQDEYRTHEALEALKIRFICREPGCGEELSDPGSMWRHYQEWHSNETHVFTCPYTSCGSLHATSDNLEEHIEVCHRQPPSLPTEPEIICLEGSDNMIDDEVIENSEENYYDNECLGGGTENLRQRDTSFNLKSENQDSKNGNFAVENGRYCLEIDEFASKNDPLNRIESESHNSEEPVQKNGGYSENSTDSSKAMRHEFNSANEILKINDSLARKGTEFPKNEDLLITEENFLVKHEVRPSKSHDSLEKMSSFDVHNVVYVNSEVTITKNVKNEISNASQHGQEHRIDLGNLERLFRSGFERNSPKIEESNIETNSNCSDDEEYTPKKQRMSRYKQESYKCEVNGCGKMYKYISHYRHHQDSHKLVTNAVIDSPSKLPKPKQGKAATVSFFLCKMPGCGAEVNNVTGLWKHYQDNHANSKPPVVQSSRGIEMFRCKLPGCELEFNTTLALYRHFNDVHTNNFTGNSNANVKTGDGSSLHFTDQMFHDDATAQHSNFKTDFKANHKTSTTSNDNLLSDDDQASSLQTVNEESQD